MEERQLIEGCRRGDSRARRALYELHASAMMSVCLRYVGNSDTARDLLHDGFVKLFTKIHSYSGRGSFNGWMRRIFVTTALEHLRRGRAWQRALGAEELEFQALESDVSPFEQLTADDLFACIARLPTKYRIVFNMYAIEEYPHIEIARELGISENTVRSQYARARQMLQKMLKESMNQ
ncbi:MAG: RNA polymerase sigma factor [Bacteroidales bacterium]|nr:RNA polymerase sigma factor [Bacteroidales bacterium]